MRFVWLTLLIVLLGVGCGSAPVIGTHPTPEKNVLVERSASTQPGWITEPPRASGVKFFVGECEVRELQSARDGAKMDMLKRYADYLGVDFNVLVQMYQEEIKQLHDEVTRTELRVKTEAEAVSRIGTRGVELLEQYWEKRDRGDCYYYHYWVLGAVEERFIEAERRRLDSIKNAELPPDVAYLGMEIQVEVLTGRTYKDGDTARFVVSANSDCHFYMLNCYGGRLVQYQDWLSKEQRTVVKCLAQFGGVKHEDVKFIVSDKKLDLETALKGVWPAVVVGELRRQALELGARYAERSVSILIEPRR